MSTTTQPGAPIVAGYPWSLNVHAVATPALFPSGGAFTAHVRDSVSAGAIRATLTTANGGIVRVDDDTVTLNITATESAAWKMASVVLDLVRTDVAPDQYLGFTLTIPVVRPVTRGL